ncbi:MAG: OmpA family protein [Deltaproteobacteria bacterium]|jgi:chemotaxis protein MotB|nr:OmpA family protein [Deltaproteobacteria bacterium]
MSSLRRPPDPANLSQDSPGWLLTFSDMVTLLLTFFVLIISITTTDPKSLAVEGDSQFLSGGIQPDSVGPGTLGFANPALVAPVVEFLENLQNLPPDLMLDQREIKAAIFQLSPESVPDYQELEREVTDSVSIFRDERGLVVRWDKAVLFPEGSAVLRPEILPLLRRMAELLSQLTLLVSLDCHTNPFSELEGGTSTAAYLLSAKRARVVLDYFSALGLAEGRFRLGAFGGGRPVTTDPLEGARNSRLEIVLYRPAKSSWKG